VNSDSGNVNTDSGKSAKVFTFNQKMCSRCIRTGVHVRPEWVFTMGRNMHRAASKKWSRPIRDWKAALNQLIIQFDDRITRHL